MPLPLLPLFLSSLSAVWKSAFIVLIGFSLEKFGNYDASLRRGISKIVVTAGMPSLLFCKVSLSIGNARAVGGFPEIAKHLWLPAYSLVVILLGLLCKTLAFRLYLLLRPKAIAPNSVLAFSAIFSATVAFPNSGAMPFALISSLCATSSDLLTGTSPDECAAAGIASVSLYIAALSPVMWATQPRLFKQIASADALSDIELSPPSLSAPPPSPPPASLKSRLLSIPPPVSATLLAIFLASTGLARFYIVPGLPLYAAVFAPLDFFGDVSVPLALAGLGAAIASTSSKAKQDPALLSPLSTPSPPSVAPTPPIPPSLMLLIVSSRLLFVPAFSFPLTLLLHRAFFPHDKLLAAVLLIESTSPCAFQLMTMCQLFSPQTEGALSKVYLFMYGAGGLTMLLWITLALKLLS
ncbi:hypothetical protein TeGR_g13721 [Tetraparma gracilis]|uniref:Auxin efflux carrier n=1 Tax=Tetraparma gracilis TaxID=2962635 RepID=A0ABQ6M6W8_9STRA|nr:hypothetical protein TeGR_g13721 [Tetraparma gracilis]